MPRVVTGLQQLHITPGALSLTLSVGNVGSLLGAFLIRPLERRFKLGSIMVIVMLVLCLSPLLYSFASDALNGTLIFALIAFLTGMALTIYNIYVVSLRQAVTPNHLLGRMNASYRFLTWGFIPLGSLLGGFLGNTIGLRPTLLIGAAALATVCLLVIFSPVAKLERMPTLPEEENANESLMKSLPVH
ncbi:hypothetical protein KDH_49110 [Dictyobacter sp. S3.2.2.5]|uniref:Major facilitator superfamily (MFS) profile domain-containing protein n=2 Tax=Dictyobacter halimunensis TaxID=3026934 RepID=A0ABQ6FYJ6_9CHLR|nr:hypothetical protein KDH_49110 [Dictyobacter sp. S3.2.2.5]